MTNGKAELNLPDLSARTLVAATLVVALVVGGFWLLFRFHQAVLILIAGIIVSLALAPVVDRLRARGVRPGVAVGILYGLLLILAIAFLRFGAPLVVDQAANISAQLSEGYASIRQNLQRTPSLLVQRLAEQLPEEPGLPGMTTEAAPPAAEPAPEAPDATSPFDEVMRYGGLGANALFQIAAIFLIAFFWTIESERIKRSAVAQLPMNRREPAREFIGQIEGRVGGYVLGQLMLCAIIGALSLAAYLLIGLPYALVLALFVAVMEIIPFVGPIIGAVPSIIIGFSQSPTTALWAVVASLVIHQLESNVFGPRVMKRTLNMRPLVTLLALTAFGTLFGVLGAIVALPLASVLQLIFDRFLVEAPQTESNADRDKLGRLRYETQELMEDVRKVIRRRETEAPESGLPESETVEDTLEAIALDLDSLLARYRKTEETGA
ncbi:conserved membrane protein of unknown function [Candidatus Promineifilum breve]|uniref:AI-2E family transporter n=1 Tax=Candidatus Promineifilum breve TaxID=1806508 RepID=A0A160T195_9CHLR|nr:AI-2E family transporter [Candidatus Promineifilum breve]CUS03781.2 conserved membrane protein of unknown function [Candidatus Promineifilum breve]